MGLLIGNLELYSAYSNLAFAALSTKWDSQGPDCPYSFCLYPDNTGSPFYLKNGSSGVATSSTSAATLLTTAVSGLSSGGSIWIRHGDYNIISDVTVTSNITIFGEGARSRLFTPRNTNQDTIFNVTGNNVEIYGLFLSNTATPATTLGLLITSVGSITNLNVHDNYFYGSNGPYNVDNCYNCDFVNNYVTYSRTGPNGRNFYGGHISNNRIYNTHDNSIDVGSVYMLDISGNTIRDDQSTPTIDNCIYVDTVFGQLTINDNICSRALSNGIQINSGTGISTGIIKVSDNIVNSTGMTAGGDRGIYIFGTLAKNFSKVSVVGNTVCYSGREGIALEYVQNSTINNNISCHSGQLSSANGQGIRGDYILKSTFTGNKAHNNTQYGLSLASTSDYNTIKGNNLIGNGAGPISYVGSNNQFNSFTVTLLAQTSAGVTPGAAWAGWLTGPSVDLSGVFEVRIDVRAGGNEAGASKGFRIYDVNNTAAIATVQWDGNAVGLRRSAWTSLTARNDVQLQIDAIASSGTETVTAYGALTLQARQY